MLNFVVNKFVQINNKKLIGYLLYMYIINNFCTTWRKSVRRLFNLNYMTRSKYLPHILDCPEIMVQLQIYSRFASIHEACINSHNKVVNICCLIPSTRSVFNRNVHCLMSHLGVSYSELNALSASKKLKYSVLHHWFEWIDPVAISESHVILELIEACNNAIFIEGFAFTELNDLLTFICTIC